MSRTGKLLRDVASCRSTPTAHLEKFLDYVLEQGRRSERFMGSIRGMDRDTAKAAIDKEVTDSLKASEQEMDEAGLWHVMLAAGLVSEEDEPHAKRSVVPGGPTPAEMRKNEREQIAETVIIDETISEGDFSALRALCGHENDPRASAVFRGAVDSLKAVEGVMKYESLMTKPIDWVSRHLDDPRAACVLDILSVVRKHNKATLARLDRLQGGGGHKSSVGRPR
jgi:hypothetical protein